MATVTKEILIGAPPEKVAGYFDDPMHLPEIWPSLVEVSDVEELPTGGHRYHWKYKMAGKGFEGDSETIQREESGDTFHFVAKNTGEIPSTFDWTFTPGNGGTKVVMKADYEIPRTLLSKLTEPLVLRMNEREATAVLENLKDRIEAP